MRYLNVFAGFGITGSILIATAPVAASDVVATFATTVSFVNPAAPGFPAALSGVTVGTAVTGVIKYDAASPPAGNGFPSPFNLATRYQPAGAGAITVSLTIGGVTLSSWSGPFTAFVWNNDPVQGPVSDGLLYVNLAAAGQTVMQVGNMALPTSTFANEALPGRTATGGYLCEMLPSFGGAAFLRTATWQNLVFGPPPPACAADIAPIPGGNGKVDIDDLLAVINGWGPCGNPNQCPADIAPLGPPVGNDVVNIDDLLAVINAWGTCP
jgi:hypothetical protein